MRERSVPIEVMPSVIQNVGMIVVNWAFVDASLDAWIALIFQAPNGKTIEDEIPRAFKRKVRFLRKAFPRLEPFKQFAKEALGYVEAINDISDIRHYVVHGTLHDFDVENDETLTFVKIDIAEDKTIHQIGELAVTGAALVGAATDLLVLAAKTQDLTKRILAVLHPED